MYRHDTGPHRWKCERPLRISCQDPPALTLHQHRKGHKNPAEPRFRRASGSGDLKRSSGEVAIMELLEPKKKDENASAYMLSLRFSALFCTFSKHVFKSVQDF